MITLKGRSVYGGIAKGIISFYQRDEINITRLKINDPEKEWDRYTQAKNAAVEELRALRDKTAEEIGDADADIFFIHQMILDDSQYEKSIQTFILEERCNAEYAVARTSQILAEIMREGDSEYIRERCTDVHDASERIIRHLQNRSSVDFKLDDVSIICADDLMPSETAMLDKTKVAAFCTKGGSTNSHTAILARTMNIPALIGLGDVKLEDYDGMYAIVDGYDGMMYIEPDNDTIIRINRREEEEGRKRELLQRLKGRKNVTRDGR